MKLLLLSLSFILIFYSCKKTQDAGFAGALKTITTNSGDSGIAEIFYQKIGFSYDDQRRVSRVTVEVLSFGTGINYFDFYYVGNSQNPSIIRDSTTSNNPTIKNYYITYDDQGNKIKDSVHTYIRQGNNNVIDFDPSVYDVRLFGKESGNLIIRYKDNDYYYDTTFLRVPGEIIRTHSHFSSGGSDGFTVYGSYYNNDLNPFYQLNIREGGQRILGFFSTSFTPLDSEDYDITQHRYLSKQFYGKRESYARCRVGETVVMNTYYSKNAASEIDRIVFANHSSACAEPMYTNISLEYY